ncbi:hypothetical protein C8R42DRAFT_638763 [Lentinula raphanica]|nr:hypothetical protein C8R42DRAFT_638763 [Lentinula raphanica]
MRFALASLLLAHLAVAYARPLMASTSSSFFSRKHIDSDESKVVDTISRLNPRSPALEGEKIHNSLGSGREREQPPQSQPPQSQPPTGKEKGRGEKLLNFVHLGRTRDSRTPQSQPSQSQPPQSQAPNGRGKGRGGKLLNFVGLGRTREQPSQSQPPDGKDGKGKGRGRRFLDFIGAVGRTRKRPSHSEPPHSEPFQSESPRPSESLYSESPRSESPQSQPLQPSNATAGRVRFSDDPVSRHQTLPDWYNYNDQDVPINPGDPIKVFVTFTGKAAGTKDDAAKHEHLHSCLISERLRMWACEKFGNPRVQRVSIIYEADEHGAGATWKLNSVFEPFSFVYRYEWDPETAFFLFSASAAPPPAAARLTAFGAAFSIFAFEVKSRAGEVYRSLVTFELSLFEVGEDVRGIVDKVSVGAGDERV